ncbi:MAG: Trigger factor [Myxococcota bacterium]|nr:Trigger factor [Myxococcota bacterium]
MKVTVREEGPIRRALSIEISPEEVRREVNHAYAELAKKVRMPGFRAGKVPRQVLEQRFKPQVEADAIETLVQQSFSRAVEENKLAVVGDPAIEAPGAINPADGYRYEVTVEIKPTITLNRIDGFEIQRPVVEVTAEDINAALKRVQSKHAELIPVEGRDKCQEGDFVNITFKGTIDGKADDKLSGEDEQFELGANRLLSDLEKGIIGMTVGETKVIPVNFPADYKAKDLAGKLAMFETTLTSIRKRQLPEIDDSLARAEEYETLDQLKERIGADIRKAKEQMADQAAEQNLIRRILDENPFPTPDSMIERRKDAMVDEFSRRYIDGKHPSEFGIDTAELRNSYHATALFNVQTFLVLEVIAEKEQIKLDDEGFDAYLKEVFGENANLPKIKAFLHRSNQLTAHLNMALQQKVVQTLLGRCKLIPGEPVKLPDNNLDEAGE